MRQPSIHPTQEIEFVRYAELAKKMAIPSKGTILTGVGVEKISSDGFIFTNPVTGGCMIMPKELMSLGGFNQSTEDSITIPTIPTLSHGSQRL